MKTFAMLVEYAGPYLRGATADQQRRNLSTLIKQKTCLFPEARQPIVGAEITAADGESFSISAVSVRHE